MNSNEIRVKVCSLLTEELFRDNESRSINDDEYLEGYGMDSYAFVRMIIRIEEIFSIEIPSDLLIFNKWSTVRQICEQVGTIIK